MWQRLTWLASIAVCLPTLTSQAFAAEPEVLPPTNTSDTVVAAPDPVGPAPVATPMPAPAPPPAAPMVAAAPAPVPPGPPLFRIDAAGGSFLRIGMLLQPQLQVVGDLTRDGYSRDLFIRRTRILLGGALFGTVEFFMETDYPNLFLANNVVGTNGAADTAVKNTPGMNVQDAFGTWKILKDYVKVDFGYTLPALAHNALQGATSLLSWDYFNYSFQHSGSFQASANPIGRDLGVQARGLLLGGHVEYRAGLFQGLRNGRTTTEVGSRNFFRFAGRLQINLLDPETGFFYQGTYLGTKKVVSIGGSADIQDEYRYFAGDAFLDMPVGPAGVATAQVNVAHWDGKTFIPTLPKQTAFMGEAGFLVSAIKVSAIVRFEHIWGNGTQATQSRYAGGLAYWPFGHNSNLKAFYSQLRMDGAAHPLHQFNLQWQIYVY